MKTSTAKKASRQPYLLSLYLPMGAKLGAYLIDQDGCGRDVKSDCLSDFIYLRRYFRNHFQLAIDINTGQIINWKKLTPKQIASCFSASK